MARPAHAWSRSTRIGLSLLLTLVFFALALLIWFVQRGETDVSADLVIQPAEQAIPLVATYTADQQACVRLNLGSARFEELLGAAPAALTDAESASISDCLAENPATQENE